MAHAAKLMVLVSLVGLGACSPTADMQGFDPREYYAEHPILNKVQTTTEAHMVMFDAGANKPSKMEVEKLRESIFDRSLLSLEGVEIQLSAADMNNAARKESLSKMLKYMGYRGQAVRFAASDVVSTNQALINMTFATVQLPDCPDWRMSSTVNYSNYGGANFGCATTVNTGLMVADPRDLERGTGELPPINSEHADAVIRQYRAGVAAASSSSSTSASGAPAATSGASSAAPSAAPQ